MIEFIAGLFIGGLFGMLLSGLLRNATDIELDMMQTPDDVYREVQGQIELEKFNDR